MIRFEIFESFEIYPFVEQLTALESDVYYPLDDDRFTIDHGADYHPFFSEMGTTRFLVAFDDDRVIGVITAVWVPTEFEGREVRAVYLADLKLDPAYRGRGVTFRMAWHAVRAFFSRRDLSGWEVVFGAAMQSEDGDVMKIVSGTHPGRWFRAVCSLNLYFVSAELLGSLPKDSPPWRGEFVDLSPDVESLCDTRGTKDLRLEKGDRVWGLSHLPTSPNLWSEVGFANYLRRVQSADTICFSIDDRCDIDRWLQSCGVKPGASCKVYALDGRHTKFEAQPIFLSTSRI